MSMEQMNLLRREVLGSASFDNKSYMVYKQQALQNENGTYIHYECDSIIQNMIITHWF